MKDTKDGCAALLLLFPFLIAAAAVVRGHVLSVLWEWFVVPLGVGPIGLVQAIGIASLAAMLTYEGTADGPREKSVRELLLEAFAKAFLSPLVALGFCWLVRWFAS